MIYYKEEWGGGNENVVYCSDSFMGIYISQKKMYTLNECSLLYMVFTTEF